MIIDKTNAEGYNDPTAYEAVKNVTDWENRKRYLAKPKKEQKGRTYSYRLGMNLEEKQLLYFLSDELNLTFCDVLRMGMKRLKEDYLNGLLDEKT